MEKETGGFHQFMCHINIHDPGATSPTSSMMPGKPSTSTAIVWIQELTTVAVLSTGSLKPWGSEHLEQAGTAFTPNSYNNSPRGGVAFSARDATYGVLSAELCA